MTVTAQRVVLDLIECCSRLDGLWWADLIEDSTARLTIATASEYLAALVRPDPPKSADLIGRLDILAGDRL